MLQPRVSHTCVCAVIPMRAPNFTCVCCCDQKGVSHVSPATAPSEPFSLAVVAHTHAHTYTQCQWPNNSKRRRPRRRQRRQQQRHTSTTTSTSTSAKAPQTQWEFRVTQLDSAPGWDIIIIILWAMLRHTLGDCLRLCVSLSLSLSLSRVARFSGWTLANCGDAIWRI